MKGLAWTVGCSRRGCMGVLAFLDTRTRLPCREMSRQPRRFPALSSGFGGMFSEVARIGGRMASNARSSIRRERRVPLTVGVALLLMSVVLAVGAVLGVHDYRSTSRIVLD